MSLNDWMQLALYLVLLTLAAWPLGIYMARVYDGRIGGAVKTLGAVENFIYRLCGCKVGSEQTWKQYAVAMLLLNLAGILVVYLLQRVQDILPLNPQSLGGVPPESSFNTAVSFGTNTNWQGYGGESTMSYLTQMLALTVQNFVSAASGMAVLVALIRGFTRREAQHLGNFWIDLTRSTLYILLPLSLILSLVLIQQGVPQTFDSYKAVALLQPTSYDNSVVVDGKPVLDDKGQPKTEQIKVTEQLVALGPVASQISIKQLGTNGGGYFNANSAHPFENPTPLSNLLEMLAILLIPAALCFTFGEMVKDSRQGIALFAAMFVLMVVPMIGCVWAEQRGIPAFDKLGVDQTASALASGGNMEGKETRFGIANSAIWATVTTAASNGSVNSMHDSYTPLGGLVTMWMIQLGEVVFGGVGSGLYGMLVFAILAVFVAGLMVGRTPEYLGKKIEAYEMKMASLIILIPPLLVVVGTAIASVTDAGTSSLNNPGAHGFSEMLYAFTSMSNNNGSAFAGLNANTPFYNLLGGVAMLMGRYWLAVPVLAIAGSLARKKIVPAGAGTLPTHTPLFVMALVCIVAIVAALAFIPALALGPIVEHLQMK